MSKPRHRRCQICDAVTARYVRSQNAGAFVVHIWETDPCSGEVLTRNGTMVRCLSCAQVQD